jgi:hypothetical protein
MDVKELIRKYKGCWRWRVDATSRSMKLFLKPISAFSDQDCKDQTLHELMNIIKSNSSTIVARILSQRWGTIGIWTPKFKLLYDLLQSYKLLNFSYIVIVVNGTTTIVWTSNLQNCKPITKMIN